MLTLRYNKIKMGEVMKKKITPCAVAMKRTVLCDRGSVHSANCTT